MIENVYHTQQVPATPTTSNLLRIVLKEYRMQKLFDFDGLEQRQNF